MSTRILSSESFYHIVDDLVPESASDLMQNACTHVAARVWVTLAHAAHVKSPVCDKVRVKRGQLIQVASIVISTFDYLDLMGFTTVDCIKLTAWDVQSLVRDMAGLFVQQYCLVEEVLFSGHDDDVDDINGVDFSIGGF